MKLARLAALALSSLVAFGCGADASSPESGSPAAPPAPPPRLAPELGTGNGSAGSVTFTVIASSADGLKQPTDLDFNPLRPTELWVVNYATNGVLFITSATTDERTAVSRRDVAASHFMPRPTSIAFGQDETTFGVPGTFATCGESQNQHATGSRDDFMGPALWSSDPSIFAKKDPDGLGSHLDMLHNTPLCMGIAHEVGNRYWVTGGLSKSIDLYDFKRDHNIGKDDHSDGEYYRYAAGRLGYVEGIPSHLVFRKADSMVYVADTGNARIVRLDPKSGTQGAKVRPKEPMKVSVEMDNAALVDFVSAKAGLVKPSGIALSGDLVFVSDHATSKIHAFDLKGEEVNRLDTGLPEGSLAGITLGPDGRLYFVDMVESRVLRIDVKR